MVSEDVRSVAAVLERVIFQLEDANTATLIALAYRNLTALADQVGMLENMSPDVNCIA